MAELEEKWQELLETLRATGGALVAFSGGVDSALLLRAAHEALGDKVLAVIARSPSYPAREYRDAVRLAELIGAPHRTVETDEVADPEYRKNPPNRCFLCKSTLFRTLAAIAAEQKLPCVLEGSNADDHNDYRPGMRAARELGVRAPLQELGLGKAEIRELARRRGLPVWDKPSLACLSSRIPYGSGITPERLSRIDQAEEVLRQRGLRQVRVRDHGDVARIETDADGMSRLLEPALRSEISAELKRVGYRFVSLDLEGYRTGAMNEALELHASKKG